jgi:hypothetical protein
MFVFSTCISVHCEVMVTAVASYLEVLDIDSTDWVFLTNSFLQTGERTVASYILSKKMLD